MNEAVDMPGLEVPLQALGWDRVPPAYRVILPTAPHANTGPQASI